VSNIFLIGLIAISLGAAAAGLLLDALAVGGNVGDLLLTYGLLVGQLAGLCLLLRNGTLLRSGYFRIIQGLLGLMLVGALFTIMHWARGRELLAASLVGIALTYTVHFVRKSCKTLLDILKLLWVLAAYIGGALVSQHLISRDVVYLTYGLLWLAVIKFVRVGRQAGTLYQGE
jgi:hypothetical protein